MADFIFEANIAHYKDLLAAETDARKIVTLRRLLAEEEGRDTSVEPPFPPFLR